MHRRAILAIARKDALDALINRSTMMVLITPIVLALLFAVITQLFSDKTTNVMVYNPGGSAIEQVVSGAFSNPKITRASSPADVASTFGADGTHKSSDYAAGLVVPADFEASLRAGGHPQLQLFVNGDEIGIQQRQLLLQALSDYSRAVANPTPPASMSVATINPPNPSPITDLSKFYAMAALLSSFMVGTSLMPGLLIEEKEKKTLRMLMVSSASWGDIVAGKLLVGLGYQLVLAAVVLAVTKGFAGQVPLVLLYVLLGSLLSLVLGLLFGSIFKTTSAAGAFAGMTSFLYIVPVFFVGSFGQALGNNVFAQAMKLVPTYYLADGVINALQDRATAALATLDIAVVAGCIIALFVAAVWALRRQASVAGAL